MSDEEVLGAAGMPTSPGLQLDAKLKSTDSAGVQQLLSVVNVQDSTELQDDPETQESATAQEIQVAAEPQSIPGPCMPEKQPDSSGHDARRLGGADSDQSDQGPEQGLLSCTACNSPFTATQRRHHCRCCGRQFCGPCTRWQATIPHLGYKVDTVRVCFQCLTEVEGCWPRLTKAEGVLATVPRSVSAEEATHGVGGVQGPADNEQHRIAVTEFKLMEVSWHKGLSCGWLVGSGRRSLVLEWESGRTEGLSPAPTPNILGRLALASGEQIVLVQVCTSAISLGRTTQLNEETWKNLIPLQMVQFCQQQNGRFDSYTHHAPSL